MPKCSEFALPSKARLAHQGGDEGALGRATSGSLDLAIRVSSPSERTEQARKCAVAAVAVLSPNLSIFNDVSAKIGFAALFYC